MVLSLSCRAGFALFAQYRPVSLDWWMLGAHGGEVSSSRHHIPSQLAEEICDIYLVVPKLLIFHFTASFNCYLGFTFKWKLTLLSISRVSYSHDSNEVRVPPILLCARQDEMKENSSVCNAMLWVISSLIRLCMSDGNKTGNQACKWADIDDWLLPKSGYTVGEILPAAVWSQATNPWLFSSKLKHTATLQCTIYIWPPLFGQTSF